MGFEESPVVEFRKALERADLKPIDLQTAARGYAESPDDVDAFAEIVVAVRKAAMPAGESVADAIAKTFGILARRQDSLRRLALVQAQHGAELRTEIATEIAKGITSVETRLLNQAAKLDEREAQLELRTQRIEKAVADLSDRLQSVRKREVAIEEREAAADRFEGEWFTKTRDAVLAAARVEARTEMRLRLGNAGDDDGV